MAHRRALVLVNRAGRRGQRRLDAGVDILEAADYEVTLLFARDPDRIPAIIRADHGGFDAIVIGGGDGTLSHACEAMLAAGKPLGILPMGNANDLAATLCIPVDPVAACRIVAAGHTRRIDIGRVNGRPFLNVASLGVSVAIARRLTGAAKRRWGLLAYVRTGWQALEAQRSFEARITCDGDDATVRAILVAVGNGLHHGGGMKVADDAAIDDQCLDVYAIPRVPHWRWLTLLPALFRGTHRHHTDILTRRGRTVHLETDRPMSINVDGEVIAATPADFTVEPAALEVFAP